MADSSNYQSKAIAVFKRLKENINYVTPNDRKELTLLVVITFGLWIIGRLDFSFAWVLIVLTTFTLWRMQKARKTLKRKHVQLANNAAAMSKLDLPSWVFFPESEKADWMNKVIAQMWPYISEMVRKILKESVEPEVQKNMPSSLKGLYFDKITLGNKSPTIGAMKSYISEDKADEFILDLELIYAGNAEVKLKVKNLTMGIADITLKGKLRVIFKPLVAQYNPIGGITVFFINPPQIDFNMTNVLNVLDAPGLKGKLRTITSDVIASFMVLPNRIAIPLAEGVDPSDLMYPIPEGVLRVNVFEANSLIKADIGFVKEGKSDPYAVVEIGAQKFKTKTKENCLDPVWNETFDAFVDNTEGQDIGVYVFDKDTASKDKKLGMIETDIVSVVTEGKKNLWLPLQKVKQGRINLKLEWLVLSDSPLDLKSPVYDENVAALMVKIISAKDLPKVSQPPSVYCQVTVGNTTHQTYALATDELIWKQMFRFLVNKPTSQNVEINVIESKGEKLLGKLSFAIGRLIHTDEMIHEEELKLHQRDKSTKGTLTCKFILRGLVTPKVRARTLSQKSSSSQNNNQTNRVCEVPSSNNVPAVIINGDEKDLDFEEDNESFTSYTGSIYDGSSRDSSLDDISDGSSRGEVELTLKYNHLRNRLVVKVHSARALVSRDSPSHTSPRVRVYLLPDHSSKSRRETEVVKATLNPVFNSTFEYPVGLDMLRKRKLDVAVKNERAHLLTKRSRHFLGHVVIDLSKIDLTTGVTAWYSISP